MSYLMGNISPLRHRVLPLAVSGPAAHLFCLFFKILLQVLDVSLQINEQY